MGDRKFDKRIMWAARIVLLAGGFMLGASAAGVFFNYNPDVVRAPLRIVIMISCGLVLGVALMLTARPIVSLILSAAIKLKKVFAAKKPIEVVGYVLGIALGLMITFVVYVLLSVLIPIPPLNIVLTLAAAFIFCITGAVVCAKWLTHEEAEESVSPPDDGYSGYLMTSAAFYSDRAETLVKEWLQGKVFVLSPSIELIVSRVEDESAVAALKVYKALKESGRLKTVQLDKEGGESELIIRFARSKRLAVLAADESDALQYKDAVKTLCLSAL